MERSVLSDRLTPCERDGERIVDPDCRFAVFNSDHECANALGVPLRPGQSCWWEARQETLELADVDAPFEARADRDGDRVRPDVGAEVLLRLPARQVKPGDRLDHSSCVVESVTESDTGTGRWVVIRWLNTFTGRMGVGWTCRPERTFMVRRAPDQTGAYWTPDEQVAP